MTIPASAVNVTLSFWVRIDTAEWVTWFAADRMRVQISNNGGGSWVTLATYSNLNANPRQFV